MSRVAHTVARRGRAKAEEAALQAHARAHARMAVRVATEARCVAQRLRLTCALFDAVADALAEIEGADVTGPRLSAKAGQIYPYTASPRDLRAADADAAFK